MESIDVELSDASDACVEQRQIFYQPIRQNSIDNSRYNNYKSKNALQIEHSAKTEDVIPSSDKQYPRQIRLKPTKLACKTVGLKRVSFGSSKGSMVETLVFETPTPLSEHSETQLSFVDHLKCKTSFPYGVNCGINMNDSGIDVPEESERSIVRVSIYQSNQPKQIWPPNLLIRNDQSDATNNNYSCIFDDIMTAASTIPNFDRQQSTDSGWDNPFRPGGDLSREADEIVNMITGGKPITPTGDFTIANGNTQREEICNGTPSTEAITRTNVNQSQSAPKDTNHHRVQETTKLSGNNNGVTSLTQVSKQVVPGPILASHVVIDGKKNTEKGCCIIQ